MESDFDFHSNWGLKPEFGSELPVPDLVACQTARWQFAHHGELGDEALNLRSDAMFELHLDFGSNSKMEAIFDWSRTTAQLKEFRQVAVVQRVQALEAWSGEVE